MCAPSLAWGVAQADQGRASDANLGLSSVSAAAFSSCAGRADGCVHMILRSERATKASSARGHSTPHVERHSPPALHLFCGTAAHERTWFRDASTSRHAFTSIASFPALAHDGRWAQSPMHCRRRLPLGPQAKLDPAHPVRGESLTSPSFPGCKWQLVPRSGGRTHSPFIRPVDCGRATPGTGYTADSRGV